MKKALIGVVILFCLAALAYVGIQQGRLSNCTDVDSTAVDTSLVIPDSLDVDSIVFQVDSLCNE